MKKEEFTAVCNSLMFRFCQVDFIKNVTMRGFILPKGDSPKNAKLGLFELSMGNMRISIHGSKIKSIKEIKNGN